MIERGRRADRELIATLGVGLLTNGVWDMLSVIVPLYAVAVGLSAYEVGFIVSARSVLPAALSIHGGILMDQLGMRRVLLWVAGCCTVLPLLYPVWGWFATLSILQLLLGLASALGMSASQTWAMRVSRGETALLARFSVATRSGTFIGPVVVGAVWDHFGTWAAFGCVALTGAFVIAATTLAAGVVPDRARVPGIAVLLPRWEQHKQVLLSALVPSVAFILVASFLRGASSSIQSSLFVVYLNGLGMSGTLIGTLVSIAELSAVAGSLMAARVERSLGSYGLVLLCIAVSLVCIASTPLIASMLALLIAACVLRGVTQGMSQPLMYAILGDDVADNRLGSTVGLRNAVVRVASIVTPTVMGLVAERHGIEASFYVIGAVFLASTGLLALVCRKQA